MFCILVHGGPNGKAVFSKVKEFPIVKFSNVSIIDVSYVICKIQSAMICQLCFYGSTINTSHFCHSEGNRVSAQGLTLLAVRHGLPRLHL